MAAENKTAKIAALKAQGLKPKQIAEIVHSSEASVRVALCRIRNGGQRKGTRAMMVELPPAIRAKLEAEAKRRGIREQDLAAAIIKAVVNDGIISAVIDDDGDARG